MRIWLLLCLLFGFIQLQAAEVKIKTIEQNDKSMYLIEVGAFSRQEEAKTWQKIISKTIHQQALIVHAEQDSPFTLQIGPMDDYLVARNLHKQIQDTLQAPASHSVGVEPKVEMSSEEGETPAQVAEKTWNLRNADIRAVIAEVSRVTKKNFIIDPRVQGKISIVSNTPISDKELYQVFLSMLQVSGYAAIPGENAIKIVPNMDAKTFSPDQLSLMKHPSSGDDMLVQVIPVHYVPAEQLVPVLRPLMPQWSSVSAYSPSNMLILSGRANNIHQLAQIISQVDSSSSSGVDVVRLHHAMAMDVANTLKDLVKTQANPMAHNQIVLSADDRNNSILISGSKTDRLRIRLLINQLDKTSEDGLNSNTQVIYLNYLRAEDLVPILGGIAQASFSGTVGTTIGTITRPALDSTNPAANMVNANSGSSSGSGSPAPSTPFDASGGNNNPGATPNTTGANTQNEGSAKPTVQIIAEPNTNSIIINAPATLIRMLKSVINQLDIKPAQILVEALVAEINQSDVNSLGIEWGSVDQNATTTTKDFHPGFAILNSKTKLSDFQAQIYALAREHKANILSTPSVVVLDNRQAKILIGKQLSVASTTYPNNGGGTTTASPYTTYERVNVALHLYVRPQITRGDGIQLQIDQGNDTLDPSSTLNSAANPVFNISAIVTAVHVESGDIVVLGGLSQDSLGNDDNKLPILGDIPGVGRLFQHNITSHEKKVLMVFIRPLILKSESNNLSVTGSKYQHVRQIQLEDIRDGEDQYDPRDMDVVLPPLHSANLPRPFAPPAPPPQTMLSGK